MRLVTKLMHKPRVFLFLLSMASSYCFATEAVTQDRQMELANLLEQDCGSCHGSLLKGGLGPSLLPDALKEKSPEFIKKTILDGRPNTAMPPWRPLLSEADVDWLTTTLINGALLNGELQESGSKSSKSQKDKKKVQND